MSVNPLLASVCELATKGVDATNFPYRSKRLGHLANRLLTTDERRANVKAVEPPERLVVCFSGGLISYCTTYLKLVEETAINCVSCFLPTSLAGQNVYRVLGILDKKFGNKLVWYDFADNYLREELKSYAIRNLVTAVVASEYGVDVCLPITSERDKNSDTAFFRETQELLTEFYGRRYKFTNGYGSLTLRELVDKYLSSGGTLKELAQTHSCTESNEQHCGVCYHCYRRFALFQSYNYTVDFAVHPSTGANYYEHILKAKNTIKEK